MRPYEAPILSNNSIFENNTTKGNAMRLMSPLSMGSDFIELESVKINLPNKNTLQLKSY